MCCHFCDYKARWERKKGLRGNLYLSILLVKFQRKTKVDSFVFMDIFLFAISIFHYLSNCQSISNEISALTCPHKLNATAITTSQWLCCTDIAKSHGHAITAWKLQFIQVHVLLRNTILTIFSLFW